MLVNIIQNTISSFRSALAAAEVITTNLKMWLGFETSSIDGDKQITPDKSGNNNVGELFTGKALDFDGSNDYVSANSFAGTLSTGDAFTFAIWFNSDKTPTDFFRNILISSGGPQQFTNIFKIGVNPQASATGSANVGGIYFDDSSAAYNNVVPLSGGVNYNDGQWHRLVVSRIAGSGNQNLSFYVDGSLIGSAPSNPLWDNVNLFDFGQEWDGMGTSDHFQGKMSDIQVYDYAWTTDDIAYDYANPQNLVTDRSGTSIALSNLKGYWALSEGAGSLVYDSSGEGNNGTINGATYEPAQPRIPQLGMMNWSKPTIGSDVVTLIPNPNNTSQDILGNAIRDRLNSLNLDGSGYAEVANDASINPTTEITVQCWIQFNSENDKGLVGKWKNPQYDYMLYKRTDTFSFFIGTTSGTSGRISSSGWVNLAATYDGSNIKTYINGDLSTTTSHSKAIPNNTNVLEIGRFSENPSKSYSERISDVLLYDTALDADEIENNYNAGLSAHTN